MVIVWLADGSLCCETCELQLKLLCWRTQSETQKATVTNSKGAFVTNWNKILRNSLWIQPELKGKSTAVYSVTSKNASLTLASEYWCMQQNVKLEDCMLLGDIDNKGNTLFIWWQLKPKMHKRNTSWTCWLFYFTVDYIERWTLLPGPIGLWNPVLKP